MGLQDQLAARFPNVTLLRLREVLEKVASVLEQRSELSVPERLLLELAGTLGVVPQIGEQ